LRNILRTIESHAALENCILSQENQCLRANLSKEGLDPPGFVKDYDHRLAIGKNYSAGQSEGSLNECGMVPIGGEQKQETSPVQRGTSQKSTNDTVVHTEVRVHGPSDCWRATVVTDVSAKRASEETAWSRSGGHPSGYKQEPSQTSLSLAPDYKKTRSTPEVGKAFFKSASKTMRLSLGGTMFADIDDMKKQVQLALLKRPYDVAEYYKDEGVFQYIARHQCFEFLQLFVISVNSIWIAVDVDVNGSKSLFQCHPAFIGAEFAFFSFFSIEWIVRFGAFRIKHNCLRDAWFVFDSMLLALMCLDVVIMPFTAGSGSGKASDTSVLKLLRITRLARMGRMAHLLKAMPELTILLKAIGIAARSVFYTLILLTIVIYIFSVAFRHLTDGSSIGDKYFPTVPFGMKALLLYGILPDQGEIADELGAEDAFYLVTFLIFILMGSLTVMNMLVGVLVEVVSVVSHLEKEQLKVTTVKSKLFDMLNTSGLAADEDMVITRPDFESLLVNPNAAKVIHEVGVDPVALVEFTDHIFSDVGKGDEGLTFESFIGWILALRGSNSATVKDVVDLRQFMIQKMSSLEDALAHCEGALLAEYRGIPAPHGGRNRTSSSTFDASNSLGQLKDRASDRGTLVSTSRDETQLSVVEPLGLTFSPVVPGEEEIGSQCRPTSPVDQPAPL